MLRNGRMPICGRDDEWRGPILCHKVAASINQLLRDGRVPILGRDIAAAYSGVTPFTA